MSTTDDDEPAAKEPQAQQPPSTTIAMSRHLQRFGSPDLEVTVGKTERLYHYHSLILASQSLYVDTILSSPAAKREQERGRISFPDIEVETWDKMIKYLSPTLTRITTKEMVELIPYYDKYQFQSMLDYLDEYLSELVFPEEKSKGEFGWEGGCYGVDYSKNLRDIASMIWPLNSFPRTKPLAVGWAKSCLRRFHSIDAEMFRMLLPLVENDNEVMQTMVSTYLGRNCKEEMSVNEMRDFISQPEFPEMCILRCKQIRELDEQRMRLQVRKITVMTRNCDEANGQYEYHSSSRFWGQYSSESYVCHSGGAMAGYWLKIDYNRFGGTEVSNEVIVVESVDVYGSAWEVYSLPSVCHVGQHGNKVIIAEEGCNHESRRVLLRWETGRSHSLVPPKYGWNEVDESGDVIVDGRAEISYSTAFES